MHVKTFTGKSNKEVLDMIKAEMGSDAVILENRNKTLNGVKVVTMTAALERGDNASPSRGGKSVVPRAQQPTRGAPAQGSVLESLKDLLPGKDKAKSGTARGYGQAAYGRAAQAAPEPPLTNRREEDAVRAMFAKAASETGGGGASAPQSIRSGASGGAAGGSFGQPGGCQSQHGGSEDFPRYFMDEWSSIKGHLLTLMKPALKLDRLGPSQRTAIEYLQKEGINDQALLELYRRLNSGPDVPVLPALTAMLPARTWGLENWPQRVHLIAGPFGSGKTSVAVRLALTLKQSPDPLLAGLEGPASPRRICLVNADCERGSGRLLLRHYAGLTDCAYREAANGVEMRSVMAELDSQNFDKIIVDLPGIQQGSYLKNLVSGLGLAGSGLKDLNSAMHLVLTPQTDDALMPPLLERYRLDLPGSVVWAKLDEFRRYGCMLNLALASGLPVSSLSFGPGLLNTLAPATQVLLLRLIFKHELPVTAW